jgi:Uma2 family endonuclease
MAPSYRHENYAGALGRFVMVLCEELDISVKSGGSTTFRRDDLERGLEPDDCFYIANIRSVLGKTELDLTVDPPPDLAIEIDVTSSSLDRMGIYASLCVPEVWRFDGRSLCVCCLRPNGEYEECNTSPTFPMVPLRRVVEFLEQCTDSDDVSLVRKFRAWVRKQIVRWKKHKPK